MNIQIFGKNKCFDTKKAQRWFKERGIKFQMIDLAQKGMSKGELGQRSCGQSAVLTTLHRREEPAAMRRSHTSPTTRTRRKSCSRTAR